MKPICVECQIEMYPHVNGCWVVYLFRGDEPYKVHLGDIWRCPVCDKEVVKGIALEPILEHWKDDIKEAIRNAEQSGMIVVYVYERVVEALGAKRRR